MKNNLAKVYDLMEKIEKNFEVEKVKYGNMLLWPILRIRYFNACLNKLISTPYKRNVRENIKIYLNYFLDFLFSFHNFFIKIECIIFSDILEKRFEDNQVIDKIFHGIDHSKTIMFGYPPR